MDAQDTGDMETGVTDATGDMMAAASTDMVKLEAGSMAATATRAASTGAIITAEAATTVAADSTVAVAATAAATGKFQS